MSNPLTFFNKRVKYFRNLVAGGYPAPQANKLVKQHFGKGLKGKTVSRFTAPIRRAQRKMRRAFAINPDKILPTGATPSLGFTGQFGARYQYMINAKGSFNSKTFRLNSDEPLTPREIQRRAEIQFGQMVYTEGDPYEEWRAFQSDTVELEVVGGMRLG